MVEGTAPVTLSALADRLVQRPPVLSDIVMLLRYSEDYSWFVGLTRRMFPEEAESILGIPGIRDRVRRFIDLVQERHFPLDYGLVEYILDEDEIPTCTWLRRGIPFRLVGYSYDDFHEMWAGFRDGVSALAILTKSIYEDHIGNEEGLRVAWLESAAAHIPQSTLDRIPAGGIDAAHFVRALKGTRFEGAASGAAWIWSQTDNFFLDCTMEDGGYDGYSDPWYEDTVESATKTWAAADRMLGEVYATSEWLEEDLPARFAELLDFVLQRLPEFEEEEDSNE